MSNVIEMSRVQETEKKSAVEQLKDYIDTLSKEQGYKRFAIVACPDDMDESYVAGFATNFYPGASEIIAVEALLDHLRELHVKVIERE